MSIIPETFNGVLFAQFLNHTSDTCHIYQNTRVPSLALFNTATEGPSTSHYKQLSFREITHYTFYFEDELKNSPKEAHIAGEKLQQFLKNKRAKGKDSESCYDSLLKLMATIYDYCNNLFNLYRWTSTEDLAESLSQTLLKTKLPPLTPTETPLENKGLNPKRVNRKLDFSDDNEFTTSLDHTDEDTESQESPYKPHQVLPKPSNTANAFTPPLNPIPPVFQPLRRRHLLYTPLSRLILHI